MLILIVVANHFEDKFILRHLASGSIPQPSPSGKLYFSRDFLRLGEV